MAEEVFWYEKVLNKPWKADNETDERKVSFWGRQFKMAGVAKDKDLRPISERILGTMRRFLLEDLEDIVGV